MFQKPQPDIEKNYTSPFTPHIDEDDTYDEEDTVETVVGPSVHVEGDFASEGDIIVKGTVSGTVKTSRELRVEAGAKVFASVHAGSAVISGTVEGDVTTEGKLEINSTAVIAGDIKCDILAVAAGARMHGKIIMDGVSIGAPKANKKRTLGRVAPKRKEEEEDTEV